MKPEQMDQEKLLTWMKEYLKRSKDRLTAQREALYDLITAGQDEAAEAQLKDMVVAQAVHSMLFEEVMEAEEIAAMQEIVANMAKDAPSA